MSTLSTRLPGLTSLLLLLCFYASAINTTWLGTVDNDWHNAANWDLGVPGPNDQATIAMSSNNPIITTTAVAQKIIINTDAGLVVLANATLTVDQMNVLPQPGLDINGTLFNRGTINVLNSTNIGITVRAGGDLQNRGTGTISISNTVNDPMRVLGSATNNGQLFIDMSGSGMDTRGIIVSIAGSFTNNLLLSITGGVSGPNGSSIRNNNEFINSECALIEIDGRLINNGNFTNGGTFKSSFGAATNTNTVIATFLNDGVLADITGSHATSADFFGGNDVDAASTGIYTDTDVPSPIPAPITNIVFNDPHVYGEPTINLRFLVVGPNTVPGPDEEIIWRFLNFEPAIGSANSIHSQGDLFRDGDENAEFVVAGNGRRIRFRQFAFRPPFFLPVFGTYTFGVAVRNTVTGCISPGFATVTKEILPPVLDNNNPVCNLGLRISDNNCGGDELVVDIAVSDEVGSSLGTDLELVEVDLVIRHQNNEDLDIYLISPSGVEIPISRDRGGTGNHYGRPNNCPNGLAAFRMDADSLPTTFDDNLTGIFLPEGDFADFNDGSDPNGTWQIRICDDNSPVPGFLEFVKLYFAPTLDNNDENCGLGLPIPDDGCFFNDLLVQVEVSGLSDLGLGITTVLEQVDITIDHTWNGDLNIGLLSPSGIFIPLSISNGEDGDDYGDPDDCPNNVVSFRMNSDNEIEDAPPGNFSGIYRPEGDFEDFNDGSDPNGIWTLFLCDGFEDDTGTLEHINLVFGATPNNDFCENAEPITCGESLFGTNVTATFDEEAEDDCDEVSNTVGGGVWYSWTGDGSCVSVTTCSPATDPNFDSKITVFEGTCGSLSCVAADDDEEACLDNEFASTVTWTSVAGTEYLILVHGFSFSAGVFELTMTCGDPSNDDVCNALSVDVGVPFTADGTCATAELGEVDPGIGTGSQSCESQDGWCDEGDEPTVDNSLWFTFVAPPSGLVNIETTSDDDPQMALWSVDDCSDFSTFAEIAANDDNPLGTFSPRIDDLCLVPGQTYYIQIDGFEGDDYMISVIINDVGATPLAITCPANVTIDCNGSTFPSSTGTATANTNDCCTDAAVVTCNSITVAGTCIDNSIITRTWTATYPCGAVLTCDQTITIEDTDAPVIACPSNVTVDCDDSIDPADTGMPTATDNCDADITFNSSDATAPGSCTDASVVTRTWTATDNCGNTSTACDQIITVEDLTAPSISCPADAVIECDESIDPANTGEATGSDNCDSDVMISYNDVTTAGSCPDNSVITRTWTATDNCGNSTPCDQTITIQDTTAPAIVCNTPSITITPDSTGAVSLSQAEIDDLGAGSNDNCGTVSFSLSQSIYTCADEGANTETLTATDECGNSSTCSITVNVDPFLIVNSITVTDETCDGAGDGMIEIDATAPGGQIGYSIDGGANFQFGDKFVDLTPGSYTVVVKVFGIPEICEKTSIETLNAGSAAALWYEDVDGDDYTSGNTITSCVQPTGYIANPLGTDCDDNDPAVNPGASEICDGKDNDCDGTLPADEADADGDGFAVCEGDCDDNDPSVYPGATEVCDGADNNCNGVVDEGVAGETFVGNVFFSTQAQLDAWLSCYDKIDGTVTISGATITDLGPLSNIVEITGNLTIQYASIANMAGLDGLSTVGGSVTIFFNSLLTSLDGLEALSSVGASFSMYYNFLLDDCCAIYDLLNNGGVTGTILIFFNKVGCNSVGEILANCTPFNSADPVFSVGNGNQSVDHFAVYPNPASQVVNVVFQRNASAAKLQMTDLLGRTIFQTELEEGVDQFTINLQQDNLQNGIYLISLIENGERRTKQLVVQK
ncbi:MAG: MopE-related protein [Bacteroidota bacterium]